MPSQLFYSGAYLNIEQTAAELLNGRSDILSASTAASPRAVGDAVQEILAESFQSLLGPYCAQYSADFARRAMADLAFADPEGYY